MGAKRGVCDGSNVERLAEPNGTEVFCICCGRYFPVTMFVPSQRDGKNWYKVPSHVIPPFAFDRKPGLAGAFSS